ncbi:hypothetical protein BDN71DRAFT_571047 [Pleurotus eryngii]|uniref:Uncharacterized protein n=1 Tax=Pleurotus eryngii TaxID=5323 RepID=A0A9P5ZI85_PLEER|nr:hypothetical protein BDN71DRAFT_571047 [Pleurotus eryngii]
MKIAKDIAMKVSMSMLTSMNTNTNMTNMMIATTPSSRGRGTPIPSSSSSSLFIIRQPFATTPRLASFPHTILVNEALEAVYIYSALREKGTVPFVYTSLPPSSTHATSSLHYECARASAIRFRYKSTPRTPRARKSRARARTRARLYTGIRYSRYSRREYQLLTSPAELEVECSVTVLVKRALHPHQHQLTRTHRQRKVPTIPSAIPRPLFTS